MESRGIDSATGGVSDMPPDGSRLTAGSAAVAPDLALTRRRITLGHLPLQIYLPEEPLEIIEQALEAESQRTSTCSADRSDAGDGAPHAAPVAGTDEIEPFQREPTFPYWVELWPSSIALGRRLIARDLRGCRVIELGCGIGLAGIAAARAGAQVVLTDNQEDALAVARRNAEANHLDVETRELDWFAPRWTERFDLVIGADLVYEKELIEPLAALIPRLLAPSGHAIIADPGRSYLPLFVDALRRATLAARLEPTYFYWDRKAHSATLVHIDSA